MKSTRLRAIAAGVTAAIGTMTFHPAVAQRTGQPTLPGEPCQTAPLEKWTPQEKWVWSKVCVGEIADFNKEPGYGGDLDPKKREDWPESRVLTSRFLETILLHEPFRSAQTRRGVRIIGAWFKGRIELSGAEIERELWLDRSRLDKGGSLAGARTGLLSLNGSVVGGKLDMDGVTVGSDLFMRRGAEFQAEVDLAAAKIGDWLDMAGSTFAGKLDMASATVGGHLVLHGADLTKASLDGRWLSVAGYLDLRTAKVSTIDLRGASVVGELWLFESVWEPRSTLDLRHAKVGRLAARIGQSSPGSTRLAGFTYDVLGSTASRTDERGSAEDAADFVERWLREEEAHSPQAHEQFALVLRQMGFPDRARRTLYEGKNHELAEELRRGHLLQAGWLFVQWAMIGYGYRVWHALLWIAALVAVGWLIGRKSGSKVPDNGEPLGFWYSVDRLLPIVELRKRHYDIDLPRRSRVYFYIHTVMGYVLATFLLAGLSGLVG